MKVADRITVPTGLIGVVHLMPFPGDLFDLDSDKAVEYFRLSCDLDEPIGCYNLGVMYFDGTGVDASPVLAENLFQKACERGYEFACNMLRPEPEGD